MTISRKIKVFVAVCLALLGLSAVRAQQVKNGPKSSIENGKRPWRVQVSKELPTTVTLHAVDVPLTDIAAEIGKQLNVPVALSPVMKLQRVTLDVSKLPLESLLHTLAPQPYVDYMLGGGVESHPKYVAIYLTAYNEPAPAADAVVKGSNEAILIEGTFGDPDSAPEQKGAKEETRLHVSFERQRLNVRSQNEPLSVILYKIADAVRIPFELKYEGAEPVTINISDAGVEQAMRNLPPNVRLYYRLDLQSFDVKPLRLVLFPPNKG